jgi:hypothetical protein
LVEQTGEFVKHHISGNSAEVAATSFQVFEKDAV